MDLEISKPGVLRFIRNSSIFGKMSTAVGRANEKPEYIVLWFSLSSGAQIRTEDLRVMSPTSCHCSTPHRFCSEAVVYHPNRIKSSFYSLFFRSASII
jgi:hypothetical protein